MTALGTTYEYDVFFSYAWAADTDDHHMRDWSRRVADGIAGLLRQRFNVDGTRIRVYIDRDEAKSAQDLDADLKSATERSAIFVAMISNYYGSGYCQREMNWFCDQVDRNGASLDDHVCLLRIQGVGADRWPARFKSADGRALLYKDICDERGQPLNMAQFMFNGPATDLAGPIERAAIEIGDKIEGLKKKIQAKADFKKSQLCPYKPLLFFEAEPQDRERWAEYGRHLNSMGQNGSIVLPADKPLPANAVNNSNDFKGFDGFLMLRAREDDEFGDRIKSAYLLLRTLALSQNVRWAVLDELDEIPPISNAFEIPHVRLQGDWVPELKTVLFD